MKKILFLRKKTNGQNSIEEIAYSLVDRIYGLKLVVLPEYDNTLLGIIKNIKYARKNQGDINHIFYPGGNYLVYFLKGLTIITWHDVGTLLKASSILKRILVKIFWIVLPSMIVKRITCVSGYTAAELAGFCPQQKKKIIVIHNPYNEKLVYAQKDFNEIYPVILHIGTVRRKNILRVITALQNIECKLIIVGSMSEEILACLQKNDTDYTAYTDISFNKIIELYRVCDIVSFPSLYEGFGMPLIEANVIGRVILTSRVASIPEIARDSACFVNPNSIQSIRTGFLKIISDDKYRRSLIKCGLINAKRFTLDNIVSQYERIYGDYDNDKS
jgi:glycosyltransferase involved in cell wall biosynthesis